MANPFDFVGELRTMNEQLSDRLDQIIDRLDQIIEAAEQRDLIFYGDGR